MRVLLDTHVFLWYVNGDKRLSNTWRDHIRSTENEVYLSVVSIWEAMIKYQLGKLSLPQPPAIYLPTQRTQHHILSLVLDEPSVTYLAQLPPLHRDPFDRILIWQANVHGLNIMTDDNIVRKYPVAVFT